MDEAPWLWIDFLADEERLELLTALLEETGPCGSQFLETGRRARLRVWWSADRPTGAFLEEVRTLATRSGTRLADQGSQPRQDWLAEWRRHRRPFRASEGFLVCPPEQVPEEIPPDVRLLLLDHRRAFGSGHHETTRLCLQLLEEEVRPGDRVLDVGAGSAILSVAAALLGAQRVVAVESDPELREEILRNLEANEVRDRVRPVFADFSTLDPGPGYLVVANLILTRMLPLIPMLRAAARGRALLLSGLEAAQEAEAVEALEQAGFRPLRRRALGEWRGLCFEG